jgi:hypothetical protein
MSKTAVPCRAVMIAFLRRPPLRKPKRTRATFRISHPLLSAGSTVSTDSTSSASSGRLGPLGAALYSPTSSASPMTRTPI